jgi:hypothetical protein
MSGSPAAGSRLRRLVRERPPAAEQPAGRAAPCDLCGGPLEAEHRHVLDLDSRELRCACRPCALLFDHRAAGGGHFKLVPERVLLLEGFALDDATWDELRIPVDMAFFFRDSRAGRVQAFYPGPMGATESLLGLEAWEALERANPVLAGLEPDVEALLVDRARGRRRHFLVGVDECYRLVAVIRTRWRGFSGGKEVWEELERFFEGLRRRAQVADARAGTRQASAAAAAREGSRA